MLQTQLRSVETITKSNLKLAAAKSCNKRLRSLWLKTIKMMIKKIALQAKSCGNRIIMTSYLAPAQRTITLIQLNINVKTIYSYATKTKRNKTSRAVCRPSQMSKQLQMSLFRIMTHQIQIQMSVIRSSLLPKIHQ